MQNQNNYHNPLRNFLFNAAMLIFCGVMLFGGFLMWRMAGDAGYLTPPVYHQEALPTTPPPQQQQPVYTFSTAVPTATPFPTSSPVVVITLPPASPTSPPEAVIATLVAPPLPDLPNTAPYSQEDYNTCIELGRQGRISELPEPQQSICRGYYGS